MTEPDEQTAFLIDAAVDRHTLKTGNRDDAILDLILHLRSLRHLKEGRGVHVAQ